jgi:hypothetical protein
MTKSNKKTFRFLLDSDVIFSLYYAGRGRSMSSKDGDLTDA